MKSRVINNFRTDNEIPRANKNPHIRERIERRFEIGGKLRRSLRFELLNAGQHLTRRLEKDVEASVRQATIWLFNISES